MRLVLQHARWFCQREEHKRILSLKDDALSTSLLGAWGGVDPGSGCGSSIKLNSGIKTCSSILRTCLLRTASTLPSLTMSNPTRKIRLAEILLRSTFWQSVDQNIIWDSWLTIWEGSKITWRERYRDETFWWRYLCLEGHSKWPKRDPLWRRTLSSHLQSTRGLSVSISTPLSWHFWVKKPFIQLCCSESKC